MTLDGREVDVRLDASVTDTTYDLSMETSAPLVITIQDQQRQLRRSGILDRNKDGKLDASVEITLDDAKYRLAGAAKVGNTFTLTFEDRVVALLKSARGPLKPRGEEDHVRFARLLVTRVGAQFVTPTGVAVIESGSVLDEKRQRAEADDRRERGIGPAGTLTSTPLTGGGPFGTGLLSPAATPLIDVSSPRSGTGLTVQGAAVTPEQVRNIEVAMGVAGAEEAGQKATLALNEACIVESRFLNLPGGDRDSAGILQVRVGLHGADVARSVSKSCRMFLTTGFTGRGGAIQLAKDHPEWSAGQVAQAVQGSAFPDRYDTWRDEAVAIVEAYGGLGSVADRARDTRAGVLVQRGTSEDPNEDSWTALLRIGEAKGFRVHALRNRVYYAREQDLINSRPRAVVSEDDPAVDWIDWEVSPRMPVNVATVQCRASLWAIPPGTSVLVRGEGVADGRWLVSSFRRSRDSKTATVQLRRGTELLKPAQTLEGPGAIGDTGSVWAGCMAVSDQRRRYLYGGGHGKLLKDIDGREPLDCSSSVSLALKLAGVFPGDSAIVSGQFASSWGEPGKGRFFTVWANSEHVWIEFHGGHDGYRFDTSRRSGDDNQEPGPRVRKGRRETTGFKPRHVKGA
jgi:hypothetical protein